MSTKSTLFVMKEEEISPPKPPFSALGRELESTMRKAVLANNLLEETKIAIALSGGKDSLTLLVLLNALSGRGFPKLDLHAIYVSGQFSCGPALTEKYLKNFCDKLEIPLTVAYSEKTLEKLECYPCSRIRRKTIFETAKNLGYHTVAFGHHADDSIQTLLLNLLHKAEFAANLPKVYLQGFDITIIRPMIRIFEKDIISFARQNGFARIVCQCPVGQKSKRKEVKTMIEEIEMRFPNARKNLLLAAEQYGSDKASRP